MSIANKTLNSLVEFLRSLDIKTKDFIFEKVFILSDTSPLSPPEKRSLEKGLREFKKGKTIKWQAGK